MTNIKKILKAINRSQDDLASEVGISQGSINHYANGNRKPSYDMAWKVVNALNRLGSSCSFTDVFPDPLECGLPAANQLIDTQDN
ncbi:MULTISPECIES: helix-turn-helix domain-containing protein [unclassified Shewanella]|uniref:helix-turn-helix domain-containing protein n=1 Tax=Shewanella TaxID=22 RepID=UPI0021DA96B7|nr:MULTISPECIES: helix-turn-helix transcriptional regulator [unclassified Shewanella]MCU8044389.1 helix-turn-helix domain-containing protein [Shewanella sp. SM68]MCU8048471.1 helix-turn-helix domain-containing protein [Shewanella sp. SM65]